MWIKNRWPDREGWWWFYGRTEYETRFGMARSIGMVRVRQCANGIAVARNGAFIWEREIDRPFWFMSIDEPEIPHDEESQHES